MSEKSKERFKRWREWMLRVLTMPYPTDQAAIDALHEASIKTESSLVKFESFMAFVGLKYGRYGSEIRASQETMAEAYGRVSDRTVRRWLKAAVKLGMLTLVKKATGEGETNVYEINEFWLELAPAPVEMALASVPTVEALVDEREPAPDMGASSLPDRVFKLAAQINDATSAEEVDKVWQENKEHWTEGLDRLATEHKARLGTELKAAI